MKTEKLGQESAFPTKPTQVVIGQESYNYQDENGRDCIGHRNMFGEVQNKGISKRLYIATMAMQGILSNPQFRNDCGDSPKDIAGYAYALADELLNQENR